MKKLVVFFLVIAFCFTSYAQTNSGNIFAGGALGIGGSTFHNPDSTGFFEGSSFAFKIAPEVGFFVADNFAVGVLFNYETSVLKSNSKFMGTYLMNQKALSSTFGGGLFGQLFIELDRELFLSFKGILGYNNAKAIVEMTSPNIFDNDNYITTISSSTTINSIYFNIIPSIEYFVNDNISLNLSYGTLYINQSWQKDLLLTEPQSFSITDFGVNLDLSSINLGVKFYLN
ncbi:MAG: hypothetical protein CVU04_05845 [Bacteroidetes bacterium HGW-Bacteroidetes-20]|nr:MAG: hypothetical protein CVU04_05845 [Bacteroidetes bacterium HGW-Bacteroidetes-20]